MTKDEIRELFSTHGLSLSQSDVWAVQGTPVVKHSALERLSAKLGITWDMPKEVIASMNEIVILARGTRKDGISEWSYGEVNVVREGVPGGNYRISGKQAGYPFAMAEKRAKDRVIIKLAGLHGAYSEEEADDFNARNADESGSTGARGRAKGANDDNRDDRQDDRRDDRREDRQEDRRSEPETDRQPDSNPDDNGSSGGEESTEVKALRESIRKARTTKAVTDLMLKDTTQKVLNAINVDLREDLRAAAKERLIALGWPGKGSEDAKAA
jgi:hypothetical protein